MAELGLEHRFESGNPFPEPLPLPEAEASTLAPIAKSQGCPTACRPYLSVISQLQEEEGALKGRNGGMSPAEAKGPHASPVHTESSLVLFLSVNLLGVPCGLCCISQVAQPPGLLTGLASKSHCTPSPGNALICCPTASPFAINLV